MPSVPRANCDEILARHRWYWLSFGDRGIPHVRFKSGFRKEERDRERGGPGIEDGNAHVLRNVDRGARSERLPQLPHLGHAGFFVHEDDLVGDEVTVLLIFPSLRTRRGIVP